ncbi:MAG: COR domain-containing protein, partial [Candidatus Promineifilaceae bacterium]
MNGNQDIQFPPKDVIGKDNVPQIMNYLRAAAEGCQAVWESKCVVVGEGGVGKTWLIDSLRGNQPDVSIVGTVGIDIKPLELLHPEQPNTMMQLNCWDFAGQDFNHAMHQFFFSNRALILLVWNARHGWQQGKIERWLDNIQVRAPEASVILVATHIDEPHSDYPKVELRARYHPQLIATIEVSSKSGKNIDQLRTLIQTAAVELPLMGVKWPTSWLAAANAVRDLGHNHAHSSRSAVYRTMQKAGNLDNEQCAILLRWLHELGDVLNFSDEAAIADYVILHPDWLTKRLGEVLRSDYVLERKGVVSHDHLRELWHDLDEHIRTLFLHIMDKFDLAYVIPNDQLDRSLIVERLPLDPPNYQPLWDEYAERGREITLRFKLSSMQPGIPTWFIARCHRFTLGRDGRDGVHWINGVLFEDESGRHRALVIANDHDRVVEMRVRGPFPQGFLSLLRDGFRDTLSRYEGLEVTRLVPCPGYDELDEQPCSNLFELDKLEQWLTKRPERTHFNCPNCDTRLSRLELVEGVGASKLTKQLTEQRLAELLDQQTSKIVAHTVQVAHDMRSYIQREFLRSFLWQQQRELMRCPNLFTIHRVALSSNVTRKHQWRIQLYSQQPGDWRPAGEPYLIDEMKDWFK